MTSSLKVLTNQVTKNDAIPVSKEVSIVIHKVQGITLNKENHLSHHATTTYSKQVRAHITVTSINASIKTQLNVKHLEIPKPLFPVNTTVSHVKNPDTHHHPLLSSKEPKQAAVASNPVTVQPAEKAAAKQVT